LEVENPWIAVGDVPGAIFHEVVPSLSFSSTIARDFTPSVPEYTAGVELEVVSFADGVPIFSDTIADTTRSE
jgi:hypothetical protein